jgi:type VI protein secretion system component Hcp
MRLSTFVLCALLAVGVTAIAPAARADGFFITLKDTRGNIVGARIAGATFTTTAPTPTSIGTAHVEIDDLRVAVATLNALTTNITVTAMVEFSKPNATGQEQVYSIANFPQTSVSRWSFSFTAGGGTVTNVFEFPYSKVAYSTPPSAAAGPPPAPAPGGLLAVPAVSRGTIVRPPSVQRVDDAYLKSAVLPDESTNQTGSRLTTVSIVLAKPVDMRTGMPGALSLGPIPFAKAAGAATATLQADLAANRILTAATFSFVQHGSSGDTTLLTVDLRNAQVKSDSTQITNGVSTENVSLGYSTLLLTDKVNGVSAAVSTPRSG